MGAHYCAVSPVCLSFVVRELCYHLMRVYLPWLSACTHSGLSVDVCFSIGRLPFLANRYMLKRGEKIKKFNRRWFVLQYPHLLYWEMRKHSTMMPARGSIVVTECRVIESGVRIYVCGGQEGRV